MITGIVGLGLIGGSLAKAYKKRGHTVFGADTNVDILEYALKKGTLDGILGEDNIKECDLILISVTPAAAIEYLKENADKFGKDQLVIDCCGIKKCICDAGFELAKEHGFLFIGGHPMAGTQFSGFKNSKDDMFEGATMALVPPAPDNINVTERAKCALLPAGFGHFSIWTADKHDEVIAFTSQLAHVVSNAYMKSPTARRHPGLSAGSYKDLTRVAKLNAPMWTELFSMNKSHMIFEIENIVNALNEYKTALINDDNEELYRLLKEGSDIKQEVDGIE